MGKTTKILLGLSIAGLALGLTFVTGLINVEHLVALYVALPVGAIFFGLFLISLMLERESAQFDREHRDIGSVEAAAEKSCCEPTRHQGRLASAKAS
jgi:hypothetical protein